MTAADRRGGNEKLVVVSKRFVREARCVGRRLSSLFCCQVGSLLDSCEVNLRSGTVLYAHVYVVSSQQSEPAGEGSNLYCVERMMLRVSEIDLFLTTVSRLTTSLIENGTLPQKGHLIGRLYKKIFWRLIPLTTKSLLIGTTSSR